MALQGIISSSNADCKRSIPFAIRAFQHAAAFGLRFQHASFGGLSAFQLFVGVLRDQSFREGL
jgi:hypothetical protein